MDIMFQPINTSIKMSSFNDNIDIKAFIDARNKPDIDNLLDQLIKTISSKDTLPYQKRDIVKKLYDAIKYCVEKSSALPEHKEIILSFIRSYNSGFMDKATIAFDVLQYAIEYNNIQLVQWLIDDSGGKPIADRKRCSPTGMTPLMIAARFGYLDIFRYLFEKFPDYLYGTCTCSQRKTFVDYAACNGHIHILQYLVSKKYNLRSYGHDAILFAVESDNIEIVEFLLNQGLVNYRALHKAASKGLINTVHTMLSYYTCNEYTYEENETLLMYSCFLGNFELFMCIVSSSTFDLNKVNKDKYGLLDFLFFKYPNKYYIKYHIASFPSRLKIVKYLVQNGINIDFINDAFLRALLQENIDVLSLLYPYVSRLKIKEYFLNITYINKAFLKAIIAEKIDILSLLYPYVSNRILLNEHPQLHANVLWNIRKNYIFLATGCSKETSHITHYLFNDLVMREILEF